MNINELDVEEDDNLKLKKSPSKLKQHAPLPSSFQNAIDRV